VVLDKNGPGNVSFNFDMRAAVLSSSNQTPSGPYKLQAIDRAVTLMDLLARSNGPMSLTDISRQLALHKSTTQRFLRVLEAHHLVLCRTDGRYHLGLRLHDLGGRALEQFDIRDRALPHFRMLVEDLKETGHLCIMRRNAIVYVDKISPVRSVCQTSRIGLSNPIYCTAVGKAMLSFTSPEERDVILGDLEFERRTSKTLMNRAALLKDLHMTRRRGYALDDEEIEDGVRCVGAPILNSEGRPVAAISISGPTFRLTLAKVPSIARRVIACCTEISHSLGYETV
jgi:DNA-binding IclR family transcriptional regulator